MKRAYSIFLLLSITSYAWGQDSPNLYQNELIKQQNAFSFQFLNQLNKIEKKANFAFSPFSFYSAFAMVYAGSKGNTAKELQNVFGFGENTPAFHQNLKEIIEELTNHKSLPYQFTLANAAFVQKDYPLRPAFSITLKNLHQSKVETVNFYEKAKTLKAVNDWGAAESKGMLPQIFTDFNQQIKLLLTNLAFLDTEWALPFDKGHSRLDTFFVRTGEPIQTKFMHRELRGQLLESANWTAVGVPISGLEEGCSITFLMPKRSQDLDTLIALPPTSLVDLLNTQLMKDNFNAVPTTKMQLYLPVFEVDSKIDGNRTLEKLGVKDAFNATKADFSNLTAAPKGLFISTVEHHCKLVVDEKGVKAAASTAVVFNQRSFEIKVKEVKINKPFVFFVRDEATKAILFVGKISLPKAP
jgi:serpin B